MHPTSCGGCALSVTLPAAAAFFAIADPTRCWNLAAEAQRAFHAEMDETEGFTVRAARELPALASPVRAAAAATRDEYPEVA